MPPPQDSAIHQDTGAPTTCLATLSPREDGLVDFSIQNAPDAVHSLSATVSFYRDAVRIAMALDPMLLDGVIPFVPVLRDDGPAVQAHFAAQEDGLRVQVQLRADGEDFSCETSLSVGFRTWASAAEGDCAWNGHCQQSDADLRLPTSVKMAAGAHVPSQLQPLAGQVTARIHQQQQGAGPNYSVVMLEATGTPLQVTQVNEAVLESLGTVDVSPDIQGGFHVWWQGQELAVTNGYPSRAGHPSVLGLLSADEQLLQATDPTEDGLLLHHDGLLHEESSWTSDDEVAIYGLNWTARESGRSLGQKTTAVRFRYRPSDGQVVDGSVENFFDVDTVLRDITYVYGNSISLSPAGEDGQRWLGITFANDTGFGPLEDEVRHAMAALWTLTEEGPVTPPLLVVNEGVFDDNLLLDGAQHTLLRLPPDPMDGQVPLDQVHKVLFFQQGEAAQHRLIVGSLVRGGDNTDGDLRARVFVYDVQLSESEPPRASWVCGAVVETENQSHQDIFLPPRPHQDPVMAVGTGTPHGETWYWSHGDSTVEDGRCALLAWHSLSDPARSETEQTAVNTWQKALTLRHLAPGVRAASVEVDMDAIAAAYAELEQ